MSTDSSPGGSRKRRALVLGSDTRAFLTVVRSLGRHGVEVHVAWAPPDALALRSRYVHQAHALPAASEGADVWAPALVALVRRHAIDLVIPCDDPSLLPLQAARTLVEPHARVYLLPDAVFAVVNSKAETYALGARLGISLPRQQAVDAATDAAALVGALGLPLALKPSSSFVLGALGQKREVRIHRTAEAVVGALAEIPPGDTWLAQEYFGGIGTGVEVLAADGEVLVAFQHRRVHEPLDGGGSSYRVSLPLDAGMLEATRRLMRALAYTGVAMVEFKLDPESGRWILVEINGRFWGSLPLAVAAGADFPAYLFDLLVEGRRTFPQAYRVGVYARNWSKDVGWLAQHLRAWRSGRVRTSPLATLARETLHVLGGRERSDTFTLDDWRPGVGEVGALARLVTDGAARTLRGRWAGLGPVRRARAARAAAAWRSARHVLFVCKGNICRSPFAERLAVARDATRRYESAGYYPKTGRPSPDTALTVAPEFGLELESHRSQIVTAEQMARADLVVIFDEENRRELARAFPGERRKVHYLGALLPDGEATITDPYGGTPDDFRRCYARIGAALARVLAPGSASVSIRPSG